MTLREELNYLLHEKAGEISMCWSDVDKAGTFDSSKAISIVEEALTAIEKLIAERYMPKTDVMEYVSEIHNLKYTAQEAYEKARDVFNTTSAQIQMRDGCYGSSVDEALRNAFGIKEEK